MGVRFSRPYCHGIPTHQSRRQTSCYISGLWFAFRADLFHVRSAGEGNGVCYFFWGFWDCKLDNLGIDCSTKRKFTHIYPSPSPCQHASVSSE